MLHSIYQGIGLIILNSSQIEEGLIQASSALPFLQWSLHETIEEQLILDCRFEIVD
jgi:hypothetical protein